jgi:hypothetical protein
MAGSIPTTSSFGSFVPTTFIWEIQQIQSSNIDPNLKEILVKLYQNLNQMAIVLNTKDSAMYVEQEFINGQIFFPNPTLNSTTADTPQMRQVFRKVINFGALPNAAAKSVAHDISQLAWIMTRMYATATDLNIQASIPIPFASTIAVNQNISLECSATDVIITTAVDYSAFTDCFVVLEYIVG